MLHVMLIDDGLPLEVTPGQYLVFDPTGRDLAPCFVVGRIDGADGNHPIVTVNGTEERYTVHAAKAVLG